MPRSTSRPPPASRSRAGDEHGAAARAPDPHFWLDPTRLADVATALGEDFARRDPANAADYRANAASLVADLDELDAEFRTGLAQCRTRELVTGHAAFGYLAERYDLHQEGIAGVSPDVEPDAATLRDLSAHVRDAGVTTVYSETPGLPRARRDGGPRGRSPGGGARPARGHHRRVARERTTSR